MMAKISNGATFGGIVKYANDIKDKDTTILASRGVDLTSNYTIAQSFKVQAMMNRKVQNCVGHFALTFSPEDKHRCTDAFVRKMAMEYMRKMGITNTQFIIFRHHDHDHDHVHVVYNRVNDYGKTISDGCDVERSIAICQAMTRQYGLHWGEGKKNVNRDRLRGKAKVKYAIYDAAQDALSGSRSWDDFITRMSEHGIQVKFSKLDGDKGVGITFVKGKVSMSGTQVDRRTLTFGKLNNLLVNVNRVLPEDLQLPDEPTVIDFVDEPFKLEGRQSNSSSSNVEDYFQDHSINVFDESNESDFFDANAIAESVVDTASSVASAAVEIMMGPDVVPSVGGGGGGSSSCSDDDEDEDEKKKKKRGGGFHRR